MQKVAHFLLGFSRTFTSHEQESIKKEAETVTPYNHSETTYDGAVSEQVPTRRFHAIRRRLGPLRPPLLRHRKGRGRGRERRQFRTFAQATSAVYKKIMREWKILSEHLPDSTYVRVYDTRIDLLRAVIVGAAGTPYHDGLFFFDIKFPPNYPDKPPKVHYHNHGLIVNPNLHQDGTVCLSLLNTWTGNKTERWVPSQSTILQVLVSIQGLVLNERPLFNDHMRLRLFEEARSRLYNEYAFVNTCRMTLYLLQNPPMYFERFTADHFCQRADRILRACNAYTNSRVGVGYYRDDIEIKDDSAISGHQVSNSFIHSMEQLYPKLVEAFKRNGALNLVEHLNLENVTTSWGCVGCCLLLCYALAVGVSVLIYCFK